MFSSVVSQISALVLFISGLVLLFAPDVVLPAMISGFPASGVWLGQMLAAAWFGVAALNWLQRRVVLGGIYGRPTVLANAALYFISALSLLRVLLGHGVSPLLWFVVVVAAALAVTYGALLLRGPFGVSERSAS